jgi:predicted ester cyclase
VTGDPDRIAWFRRVAAGAPEGRDVSESLQEQNKRVVARAVAEVINGGDFDVVDELYDATIAEDAKAWVAPFRRSFPDVHMATVALVAEGDTVVGHFRCSGTHEGRWLGKEPTGRRFNDVDEVYWFTLADGRITAWWGLEDNAARLRQLRLGKTD